MLHSTTNWLFQRLAGHWFCTNQHPHLSIFSIWTNDHVSQPAWEASCRYLLDNQWVSSDLCNRAEGISLFRRTLSCMPRVKWLFLCEMVWRGRHALSGVWGSRASHNMHIRIWRWYRRYLLGWCQYWDWQATASLCQYIQSYMLASRALFHPT